MVDHNKTGRSKSGPPFIQLFRVVKRSATYHGLSQYARCALIELLDRYTGKNNGMIGLGARELADELRCSKDTAARALRELDDAGLVTPIKLGIWRGRQATEWRLTFYKCDVTGEIPKRNLKPRPQSDERDSPVRSQGHKPKPSPMRGTQKRKNPMNGKSPSPMRGTHIDIYHRVEAKPGSGDRDWICL